MHYLFTIEPLLPREIAPLYERRNYTIDSGCDAGRYTCHMLVLFRRRYIIELKKGLSHEHIDRSEKTVEPTG